MLPAAEAFESQEDGAYYTGTAGGQTVGYVFETVASGYGGTVSVMTGIDAEGTLPAWSFFPTMRLPAGANAEKPDFLNQYLQPAPEAAFQSSSTRRPARGRLRP